MITLLWVHTSGKIVNKILWFIECIKDINSEVILLTSKSKTANFFRAQLKSHINPNNIISVEDVIRENNILIDIVSAKDVIAIYRNTNIDLQFLNALQILIAKDNQLQQEYIKLNIDKPCKYATNFLLVHKVLLLIIERISPDLILNLNGMSTEGFNLAYISKAKSINNLFWEAGLIPNSLVLDNIGVNSYSELSIREILNTNHNYSEKNELINIGNLCNKDQVHIFVPLQVCHDTNIICSSTYFGMLDFIEKVILPIARNNPNLIFHIRHHPKSTKILIERTLYLFSTCKNIIIDDRKLDSISNIKNCDITLGVNSTCLLEAILAQKKVIAFGRSSYSPYMEEVSLFNGDNTQKCRIFDPNIESHIKSMRKYISSLKINSLRNSETSKQSIKSLLLNSNSINFLSFNNNLYFEKPIIL